MKIVNDIKTIFRFQKIAISNCPTYILILSGLVIFSAVQPFISVVFPKFILDAVFEQGDVHDIVWYVAVMGASLLMCSVGNALFTNKLYFISMKIKSILKMNMAYQTTKIKYELLESPDVLNIKQNATKFLEEDVDRAIYLAPKFFSAFIAMLGYIYIISSLNIVILATLFLVIFINSMIQSNTEKYAYSYRKIIAPIERKICYFIMMMPNHKYGKDMRMFRLQDWIYKKYSEQNEEVLGGYKKVFSKRTINAALAAVSSMVQTICVYAWLSYRAFKGYLSIGDFTMYFSAISNFSGNIMEMFSTFVQMAAINRGMNDFLNFMELETEEMLYKRENNLEEKITRPCIEFKNVWFRYPGQENYVLQDISVKIPYGEKVCIVGENGAGKTTFIKLLTRLYEPTRGNIYFNGIDINQIDISEYRKMFSVVFQDFATFAFTIKENISLADCEADDSSEKVERAIKKVGLDTKMEVLPKGIDTYLETVFDEEGIQLSGGQFQKLAIARAVYSDASILVLDEPTAALDPRSEHSIYKNFYDISSEKTTFFISHRLASSRICDKVIVFQTGRIVEIGSHDELIKNQKLYSELYNIQKQYYEEEKALDYE